jgi:predicted aldo/keto reductase-like oxidoreductase
LEIKKDLSKEGFLKRFRKCLEELQTEYIDCMMIHSPEEINTIKTSGFHEAMKQLKSEGRLKYIGVSNHGSGWYLKPKVSMDKILLAAAADGRFDVMLMTYNFLQENMGAKVLEVCKEKNIGTTLMKVNPVGKYLGLKERIEKWEKEGKKIADTYKKGFLNYKEKAEKADVFIKKYNLKDPIEIRDAAIKYVLDNPNVNSVCCSMRNFEQVDMFLKLSGTKLSDQEKVKLQAYKAGCGELYCRHACGICEPECPHNVPVNTIMRYNHYFEAQGKEKYALKKYAQLDTPKADLCKDCNGACEKACPHKVPIHAMMNMAHRKLSLV